MSGSGGGLFRGKNPRSLADEIREQQEESLDATFAQRVSEWLDQRLADLNDRDVEGIEDHLKAVEDALSGDIEGTLQSLFGGSIAKRTYVDGISDVDALVMLDDSELANQSPRQVLEHFRERLLQRLPRTEIPPPGNLALTVKFADGHEIQLLPAVRAGDDFKIADQDGTGWAVIRPKHFADMLVRVNQLQGGRVVPTIKLAKAINANLPVGQQLTGYHVECLAVAAFENYQGRRTTKDGLEHFFREAANRILSPIQDVSGQSQCADEYLGNEGSAARVSISRTLARVAKTMHNADAGHSLEAWQELFGGPA
jgi:hypothetical protein